jgi:branched-chain amino acid transport system substrate-binding protein
MSEVARTLGEKLLAQLTPPPATRMAAEKGMLLSTNPRAKMQREERMSSSMKAPLSRRTVVTGTAAVMLASPALVRAQEKSLKIGVLLPRSGYMAPTGQSSDRGARIAPKVLSDYGYRVELIHVDTESSVDAARHSAERVINEGVHCIVGNVDSGGTMAVAQVCERRGVPLVVNVGAAPQITEQGFKYVVRNFPHAGMLMATSLRLIKDLLDVTKLDAKTAVFLHANDTFGMAQRTALEALFPRSGLSFQLKELIPYDPRAQDLAVEVTKVRGLNPEIVLVVTRGNDAVKIIREMVRQRFEPKAIISPGSSGMFEEEYYQTLGPYADYTIFHLPWANPKSQMAQALEAAFKPAYPQFRFPVECFFVGFTFEAMLVAADGFKRAGSTEGAELMKAIRETNIADHIIIGPPIKFDAKGQNVGIPSASVQSRNRTPTVVLPRDVATMEPLLPMPPWQGRS